jgi:hypothetical protein
LYRVQGCAHYARPGSRKGRGRGRAGLSRRTGQTGPSGRMALGRRRARRPGWAGTGARPYGPDSRHPSRSAGRMTPSRREGATAAGAGHSVRARCLGTARHDRGVGRGRRSGGHSERRPPPGGRSRGIRPGTRPLPERRMALARAWPRARPAVSLVGAGPRACPKAGARAAARMGGHPTSQGFGVQAGACPCTHGCRVGRTGAVPRAAGLRLHARLRGEDSRKDAKAQRPVPALGAAGAAPPARAALGIVRSRELPSPPEWDTSRSSRLPLSRRVDIPHPKIRVYQHLCSYGVTGTSWRRKSLPNRHLRRGLTMPGARSASDACVVRAIGYGDGGPEAKKK